MLKRTEGFELIGEAADGDEAVALAAELRPSLILMDINMPRLNGIEATRQIIEQLPGTTVFLCSTYQRATCPRGRDLGFAAYVNKEELGPDLLRHLWDEHTPPATPAPRLLGRSPPAGRRPPASRDRAASSAITTAPRTGSRRSLPPEVGIGQHERAGRGRSPQGRPDAMPTGTPTSTPMATMASAITTTAEPVWRR